MRCEFLVGSRTGLGTRERVRWAQPIKSARQTRSVDTGGGESHLTDKDKEEGMLLSIRDGMGSGYRAE